ncbi:MAG: SWIM zinc finger family protein [bacterium]
MKIEDVTKEWIEHSTGFKVFRRGCSYYNRGMIYEMEYDHEHKVIKAQVKGTFGIYKVNILEEEGRINSRCNCPSDNYICKHIVAVLLNFIDEKSKYINEEKKKNNSLPSFITKLNQCSHEQLVQIIIKAAHNNPDFKRDLIAFLEPDILKHWAIAQKIMQLSNTYGIPDEKWEEFIDCMVKNISA